MYADRFSFSNNEEFINLFNKDTQRFIKNIEYFFDSKNKSFIKFRYDTEAAFLEAMIKALYFLDEDHSRFYRTFGKYGYSTKKMGSKKPDSEYVSSGVIDKLKYTLDRKEKAIGMAPEYIILQHLNAKYELRTSLASNGIRNTYLLEQDLEKIAKEDEENFLTKQKEEYCRLMDNFTYQYLEQAAFMFDDLFSKNDFETDECKLLSLFMALYKIKGNINVDSIIETELKKKFKYDDLRDKIKLSDRNPVGFDFRQILIGHFSEYGYTDKNFCDIFRENFITDVKKRNKLCRLLGNNNSDFRDILDRIYEKLQTSYFSKQVVKVVETPKEVIETILPKKEIPKIEPKKEKIVVVRSNTEYIKDNKELYKIFNDAYKISDDLTKNIVNLKIINPKDVKYLSILLAFLLEGNKDYYDEKLEVIDILESAGFSLDSVCNKINYKFDKNILDDKQIDIKDICDKFYDITNIICGMHKDGIRSDDIFTCAISTVSKAPTLFKALIGNDEIYNEFKSSLNQMKKLDIELPLDKLYRIIKASLNNKPVVDINNMEEVTNYLANGRKEFELFNKFIEKKSNCGNTVENTEKYIKSLIDTCKKMTPNSFIRNLIKKESIQKDDIKELAVSVSKTVNSIPSEDELQINSHIYEMYRKIVEYHYDLTSSIKINYSMNLTRDDKVYNIYNRASMLSDILNQQLERIYELNNDNETMLNSYSKLKLGLESSLSILNFIISTFAMYPGDSLNDKNCEPVKKTLDDIIDLVKLNKIELDIKRK